MVNLEVEEQPREKEIASELSIAYYEISKIEDSLNSITPEEREKLHITESVEKALRRLRQSQNNLSNAMDILRGNVLLPYSGRDI